MDLEQKRELVTELNAVFKDAASVVVTQYSGLSVTEITDLRNQMRAAGANFKVPKNRLPRLALADTPYAGLADMFTGPTAIAFSEDVVAPAKVAVDYAKKNEKLVVVGGAMGENVLDVAGV
ncbi:MAG: 50S ribosomal protein L10, partial [Alphaproteobacteria bacterium]|nr:50S ribosomal protein L10 [Alphaproteobacteria bacterium]